MSYRVTIIRETARSPRIAVSFFCFRREPVFAVAFHVGFAEEKRARDHVLHETDARRVEISARSRNSPSRHHERQRPDQHVRGRVENFQFRHVRVYFRPVLQRRAIRGNVTVRGSRSRRKEPNDTRLPGACAIRLLYYTI